MNGILLYVVKKPSQIWGASYNHWLIFIIVSVLFQVSQFLESPLLSSTHVDDADFVKPAKKRSNSKVSWLWIEISAMQWQLCTSSLISTQLKNCLEPSLIFRRLFCFLMSKLKLLQLFLKRNNSLACHLSCWTVKQSYYLMFCSRPQSCKRCLSSRLLHWLLQILPSQLANLLRNAATQRWADFVLKILKYCKGNDSSANHLIAATIKQFFWQCKY